MDYNYNATVFVANFEYGVSCFVAHVDDDGYMLRSNRAQCTGLEGTREYHARMLQDFDGRDGAGHYGLFYAPGTSHYAGFLSGPLAGKLPKHVTEPAYWRVARDSLIEQYARA